MRYLPLVVLLATVLLATAVVRAQPPTPDLLATRDALSVQATRIARDIAATERAARATQAVHATQSALEIAAMRATATAQVRDAEATRAAAATQGALAFEATREALALQRAAATSAAARQQETPMPMPTMSTMPIATPTPDPTARAAVLDADRRPADTGDLVVLAVGALAILLGVGLAALNAVLSARREVRVHVPAEIIPPGGRRKGEDVGRDEDQRA